MFVNSACKLLPFPAMQSSYSPSILPKTTNIYGTKEAPSPYRAEIDLDQQIYNPGQEIIGKLKLVLNKRLNCDLLTVRLYGSARVFFTENLTTPGSVGQKRAYEQERVFVDKQQDLWLAYKSGEKRPPKREFSLNEIARMANPNTIRLPQSSSSEKWFPEEERDKPGLNTGVHEFDFQFKLPTEDDGLFTSFDSRSAAGYVRYYILIQAQNNGRTVFKRKLLFPVVCPRKLSELSVASEPILINERSNLEKGLVLVRLCVNKRGFVPGEPIEGEITIDNRSQKSVKYSYLRITQRTVCYSIRPEVKFHESFFETPGMGLPVRKVEKNSKISFPIRFYIPALLPNLHISGLIEADYCLTLDVGYKISHLKKSLLKIQTPIIIGTHPTSDVEKPQQNLPSAPPPYDEVHNHPHGDAPPSYALSIGGVSDMRNDDETLLNVAGGEYAPVCYHYNYGFADDEKRTELKEKKNK
ncbi:arrestin domain-containing protein 2 [Ditylenchus destructor]|nr:arrestin domain-containing protein 2 [Ditylenchus destructor]